MEPEKVFDDNNKEEALDTRKNKRQTTAGCARLVAHIYIRPMNLIIFYIIK